MNDMRSPAAAVPLPQTITGRAMTLFRLASPVILSRSGMLLMSVVDTVMVGRFAARELAYQSIAVSVIIPLVVTSVGLIMGTLVMTARALGQGNLEECGAAWRRGIVYASVLGTIGLVLALFAEPFLLLMGQDPDIARGGGHVAFVLGLGVPPMIIYMASAYFLEALRRPTIPMSLMVIANLVNVGFNWVWIYGNFGFEAMGAEGAAWATTLARLVLAVCIVTVIWNLKNHEALAIRKPAPGGWRDWAQQRRIGYSAGGSQLVETSAMSAQALIAGLLGANALAAYSISFQVLAMVFMSAIGIGAATAVQVGHAWGRRDVTEMAKAGWTGLGVNTIVMLAFAIVVYVYAPSIANGFANESRLIAVAIPLIMFTALLLPPDGGQAVLAHALRGRGDTWVPVMLHAFSYYVVLIPLAYFLALKTDQGVVGILEALLIASVVSMALLGGRFYWLAERDARRLAAEAS